MIFAPMKAPCKTKRDTKTYEENKEINKKPTHPKPGLIKYCQDICMHGGKGELWARAWQRTMEWGCKCLQVTPSPRSGWEQTQKPGGKLIREQRSWHCLWDSWGGTRTGRGHRGDRAEVSLSKVPQTHQGWAEHGAQLRNTRVEELEHEERSVC